MLVVDVGLGNIGSVVAALQRHNCSIQRLPQPPSPDATEAFTHAILPGVGAFAAGIPLKLLVGRPGLSTMVPGRPTTAGHLSGMQLLATTGRGSI